LEKAISYLPGLDLNLDPPDLCLLMARIIGATHQPPTIHNTLSGYKKAAL
jgi:hypothetical protein